MGIGTPSYRAASPRDLGPLVREHGSSTAKRSSVKVEAILLLVVGLAMGAGGAAFGVGIGVPVGGALAAWGVGALVLSRSKATSRVSLHEGGIEAFISGQTHAAPWPAVVSLTSKDLDGDIRGHHHHAVELEGGARFVLTDWIDDVGALVEAVRRATAPELARACQARLQAGETVSFGAIAVTAEGVEAEGKRAAFAEIDSVMALTGRLQVARKQDYGKALFTVPVAKVPNAHVLFALLQARAPQVRFRTR